MLKYLSAAVLGLAACASGADALMGVDSNVTATTIASSSSVASTSFDLNEANKNAWLSAAAYCGVDKLKTHVFKGPTTGFVLTLPLDDHLDTQGYVGYLPSDKSIYVVYRGSSNIQNWITNIEATKKTYTGDCCGASCQVHKGFYNAEQSVFAAVLKEVNRLRGLYPTYTVKATGHSLGAALALLTAMDLKNNGVPTLVYNFGQPRVGDAKFASCVASKVPTERVTHLKDTVPHVPYESWGYLHATREAYESSTTSTNPQVKNCSTSDGEDPTCAEQWEFYQTNVDDHLIYLGLKISDCNAVS